MKIMEWNIRHGGDKKKQDKIIDNIIGYDADIIILTEYRENKGERIKSRLSESGWKQQLSTEPPENTNGIFIASKYHIEKSEENYELPDVLTDGFI